MRWTCVATLAIGVVLTGAPVASARTPKLAEATLNGSGSTFQQPFAQATIGAFTRANSAITINYTGGGSGKGLQDFAAQTVDFAGTDASYPSADAANVEGGEFLYVPTVVAPIAVAYNVPGVARLALSGPTISKIFQRQITKWNDPAIARDNPKLKLPDTDITVASRSDGSGTTETFTTFLTKADPKGWKLGSGPTVSWPVDVRSGEGDAGVAAIVSRAEGAIGYLDVSDAKAAGISSAAVRNRNGKFIDPTAAAATAAAAHATVDRDLTYDPTYTSGKFSYPITAPTWILVATKQTDAAKAAALKAWLQYVLTKGQEQAVGLDYAPLPDHLARRARQQVEQITHRAK